MRGGVCRFFVTFAPLLAQRQLTVTGRRTAHAFARVVKTRVDETFAHAETIVLVLDNLNTHTKASLYQAFPPEEAKRLCAKIEWHYTPKHGSGAWHTCGSTWRKLS